jgi:hypothetical protein
MLVDTVKGELVRKELVAFFPETSFLDAIYHSGWNLY